MPLQDSLIHLLRDIPLPSPGQQVVFTLERRLLSIQRGPSTSGSFSELSMQVRPVRYWQAGALCGEDVPQGPLTSRTAPAQPGLRAALVFFLGFRVQGLGFKV